MAATQTDRVGTVWRDDMWLSNYPLNHHTAVDYFACSPFWDPGCNNGRARLEQRALTDLQGIEYTLDSCQEPHLFVICKQDRQSADAAVPVMFYYILDGSVYQTPTIHGVLSARLKALAARGRQQQQSSMLSSEPSEFHLPQIRANTPAVSGAPQS
ncbi:MAG: hypothetical protein FRX49_01261 [Trebouxia sp. A1-2]|nr:MAG: hypothetical protein FRX49_01261 [Trebouxia sp. A1-2]